MTLTRRRAIRPKQMPSRRQFLRAGISAGLVGIAGVVSDAAFIDLHRLIVKRVEVPLTRLPLAFDGLTIAQLSDFHYGAFTAKLIREAVRVTNDLHPDLIVLTGDFVSAPFLNHHETGAADALPCAEILGDLQGQLGVLAVLGNHDHARHAALVASSLDGRGIAVLRNFNVAIERYGAKLWIAGVDDVLHRAADLEKALDGIPHHGMCILLAHEPDFADIASHYPVDLQLSGHSHGGQIRLPLLGAPYLPALARKYPWGLRQVGSMTLYTNSGIGTLYVPVRLDSPPEITFLTLRCAAAPRRHTYAPASSAA